MAVQFQCPRCAHLLQADDSQAGGQCTCPLCATVMIIPAPPAPAGASPPSATAGPTDSAPGPSVPAAGHPPTPSPAVSDAAPGSFPEVGPKARQAPAPASQPAGPTHEKATEPELLHIPCPECREVLETPAEMLDQDVACPHCQAQFRLRRRDSQEYQQQQKRQREIRDRKTSSAWLYGAVAVAVLVVAFLLFLIVSSPGD